MMKYTKFIIPFLIMSLLLLTACEKQNVQQQQGAFLGGTEGLVASFEPLGIKEEGVYTIFDSEDFPIDMLLKNKGEEDIAVGKAKLRLLGPAQEDFQNIPSWELKNGAVILKKTEFNPEGGEEVVSFTPNNGALYKGLVTGLTDINWNVEYTYDYKTHLIISDVCFKGDITDDRVCNVQGAKLFAVSGAPITVTKVEEDSAGKGIILLKIDISNAGTGESTFLNLEFDRRFSQVGYKVDEPQRWECKSGGRDNEARLIEGKAQIICKLKAQLSESDLFVRSVRLTLEYQYQDMITEKLRVKESIR